MSYVKEKMIKSEENKTQTTNVYPCKNCQHSAVCSYVHIVENMTLRFDEIIDDYHFTEKLLSASVRCTHFSKKTPFVSNYRADTTKQNPVYTANEVWKEEAKDESSES